KGCASVMITGSHIPFDRNGIKFNRASGEVLKADEAGILEAVAAVRRTEYERPEGASLFGDDGMFRPGESRPLPAVNEDAQRVYLRRYLDFFPQRGLAGTRIVFFQHSAVGRDMFVELLRALGAEVHPQARSEDFIPIDTEDIPAERLQDLQAMADAVTRAHGPVDAVLSTDGDSDRPLVCGVDAKGRVRFYGGDLLGLVVAEYLRADAISVPISANDAVDIQSAKRGVTPVKTRIGSPHVIKSMQEARARGADTIVGWEANGGFLLGSAVHRHGRTLEPLPTRDGVLPILAALFASIDRGCTLVELFGALPSRFSKAGLIDQFPLEVSQGLVQRFSPGDETAIRNELAGYFDAEGGFDAIVKIDTIDGVRIYFTNGDIAHIRPSGNAPQLRLYACADSQARADEIVDLGIRDPDGILRRMERML
ncbi:MAG: phosphohexomutase domain-containing protein, partial [Planctomycetota bacterium]